MKNAHSHQVAVLPHHLQDNLRILGIAYPHRIVNASLDSLEQQICTGSGGIDKLRLFYPQIEKGKGADYEDQKDYGYEDNPGC
jgi:hypothetical protein